ARADHRPPGSGDRFFRHARPAVAHRDRRAASFPRRGDRHRIMKNARVRACPRVEAGFTLVEVLVALVIVAIALAAGLQATNALTNNALRQSTVLLAHVCAENELVKARLARQMPDIGDSTVACAQAGRE